MCDSSVSWIRARPYLRQASDGECADTRLDLEAIARSTGECLLPQPGGFEGLGAVEEDLQPRNPSIPNRPEVETSSVSRAASSESRRNWRAQTRTRPSDPSMNSNGSTATSDHSSRTRSRNASSSPAPRTRSGVPGGRAALKVPVPLDLRVEKMLEGTIGEIASHERVDVHVSLSNDLHVLLRHRLLPPVRRRVSNR